MKYRIWNVDKARWCTHRLLHLTRAARLADLLERRTGDHMVLKRVTC
jgi:hypothetical protein